MKYNLDKFGVVFLVIALLSSCAPVISINQEPVTDITLSPIRQEILARRNLSIKFLGNTTLAIEDNNSGIIIDGFLTRPSLTDLFFKRINSEPEVVKPILCHAGINSKIQAIIPLHSHFDHILDAPYLSKELGACIVADKTARIISRRTEPREFCEENTDVGIDNYSYGEFNFRVIDSIHLDNGLVGGKIAELNNDLEEGSSKVDISVDFSKPQRASSYKEGRTINVSIDHINTDINVFIISGSFDDADKVNIESFNEADVIFVSVPLLNKRKNPNFYRLVERLLNNPASYKDKVLKKKIIPFHWDNLSRRIPMTTSTCETNNIAALSYKERKGLLKAAPLLRRAIYDVEDLVDSSFEQQFEIIWMTAFDEINFTDTPK